MTGKFELLNHLTALRAFDAVARTGSIKAAAASLHVTPGAVSRLVRSLEDAAGVQLLERSHRRVMLTPAARGLADETTASLRRLRAAGDRLACGGPERAMVIGAPATFQLRWLIPRQSHLQEWAGRPVRLLTWDRPPDLRDTDVSLFVQIGHHEPDPAAFQIDFLPETFALVLAPRRLQDFASPLEAMRNLPRIVPATRPRIWQDWVAEGGVDAPHAGIIEVERMYFALQAAEAGLGIAIAPVEIIEDSLHTGRLATPFGHIRRAGTYHLVGARRIRRDPGVLRVIRWFQAQASPPRSDVSFSQPSRR